MKMLNIIINDNPIRVPEGTTILDAAKSINLKIPTLWHLKLEDFGIVNKQATCRVCMVEVENRHTLVPSCSELCTEGMKIRTDSIRAISARRTNVELLLSNHPNDCLVCQKNLDCELQSLSSHLNIREIHYQGEKMDYPKDESSLALIKDPNKCVMCRRCETMCNEVQTCGILSAVDRGFNVVVSPAFHLDMVNTSCTYCGQCVAVCPTGALTEVNNSNKVWQALNNPAKHVIVQVAPAVRVAIGEMFGLDPGTISTGKLVSALRSMEFDAVFDTDFAADLTIMEEAAELIHRIQNKGRLPMLTSCCPAWVKFFEHQFPDLLDIPSTCKSPQIMFGAIAKTYYAQKTKIDPKDIVVVSVMPCLAKKAEAARPELTKDNQSNVDIVITTRELGHMLLEAGIDFKNLKDSDFDNIMGQSSGASVIFGTTGGVIEAAVRTAYEWLTNKTLEKVDFKALRGIEGVRSATVDVDGLKLRIGIAHGLGNARKLLENIRDGISQFDVIEIMACPGGCIGGGGQPYHHGDIDILKQRQMALYQEDANKTIRKSHKNPAIIQLYDEFLGVSNSKKSHELLHTYYSPKERI